jgi:hypothetical protein
MEIPVLIRPVPGNGFQAASPLAVVAEGKTRDEALAEFQRLVEKEVQAGAELTSIRIAPPDNRGWAKVIGIHEHNPYFEEYVQAIEQYRQEVENDPDRL